MSIPHFGFDPGLHFPVDGNPTSDYDSGFNNHTSSFFSGILDTASHLSPPRGPTWRSGLVDSPSSPFSELPLLQQSTSASPSTTPPSNGLSSCSPMPALGLSPDRSLLSPTGTSRLRLPALHRLSCPQCPQTFVDKHRLNRHLSTHKPSVPCDIEGCTSLLKDQRTLKRHKQTVHRSLRPGQQSACDLCGRGFARTDNFKRHIRTCRGGKKGET
jgi:C2H2-type zinc finger/Zinc finger, C2H2 type